jgi:hypothetical protein
MIVNEKRLIRVVSISAENDNKARGLVANGTTASLVATRACS